MESDATGAGQLSGSFAVGKMFQITRNGSSPLDEIGSSRQIVLLCVFTLYAPCAIEI